MRVRIRLFARLRELAGAGELVREVAPGATVASVWAALAEEFPALGAYSSSISGAVNAEYAPMTHPVHDGDEVAFLPPVSGGAFRSRRSVRGAADTASARGSARAPRA
jgi:molybdopterin converting factor subunit 1